MRMRKFIYKLIKNNRYQQSFRYLYEHHIVLQHIKIPVLENLLSHFSESEIPKLLFCSRFPIDINADKSLHKRSGEYPVHSLHFLPFLK